MIKMSLTSVLHVLKTPAFSSLLRCIRIPVNVFCAVTLGTIAEFKGGCAYVTLGKP